MGVAVRITQQPEADALLARSPLALLTGALLDRNVPLESAFAGPLEITRRLGWDDLDTQQIADYGRQDFADVLAAKPAVHNFPTFMARNIQEMCRFLVARCDSRAATVWEEAATGRELLKRVSELPGFGRQKSQIFVALLGKQFDIRPHGWREAAGRFGPDGVFRSVADVTDPDSLARVRAYQQEERRAAKATDHRRRPAHHASRTHRQER